MVSHLQFAFQVLDQEPQELGPPLPEVQLALRAVQREPIAAVQLFSALMQRFEPDKRALLTQAAVPGAAILGLPVRQVGGLHGERHAARDHDRRDPPLSTSSQSYAVRRDTRVRDPPE